MEYKTDRLAIFDIDGTLHKTEVMSVVAHKIALAEFGIPEPTKEVLFSTYGADSDTILDVLGVLGDKEYRKKVKDRIELEERTQITKIAECYDGVLESLRKLAEDGISLAVCSMCDDLYMSAFLKKFGLDNIMAYRRNESMGNDKKILLKDLLQEACPKKAVMIGDRIFDKEAADYCNIPFIGCPYGYNPGEVDSEKYVANSGFELYMVIKKVFEEI